MNPLFDEALSFVSDTVRRFYAGTGIEQVVERFSDDLSWIGAGEVEFSTSAEEIVSYLTKRAPLAPPCEVFDEEFYLVNVTECSCTVMGRYNVRTREDSQLVIEERQRCSYELVDAGESSRSRMSMRRILSGDARSPGRRSSGIRRSVTLRARMAMKTPDGKPDPKTAPCHLTAPLPGALWTRGSSYIDHMRDLLAASKNVDPSFGAFLREAHEKHWVDGRNFASKTGNSWCDDLPSLGAVRILTHFYPNLESEVGVAHLFGVAHHLRLLHGASPAARLFPLSVTEIAGKFYEALLLRQLRKEAEGTGNESLRLAVYWLDLSRMTNFLLTIPHGTGSCATSIASALSVHFRCGP